MAFDDTTDGSSHLQNTWPFTATQDTHIESEGGISATIIPAAPRDAARDERRRTWRRRRSCRTTVFRPRHQPTAPAGALRP